MSISHLYILSFSIYIAVSTFTFMLYGAMPALLARENIPPQYAGFIFLSMLPFMLSFFYSPFIESFRKKNKANFKLLITFSQVGLSVGMFTLAFLDIANDFWLVFALFVVINTFCSLSIIALNAVGIEQSSSAQKPKLNAIMLVGSMRRACSIKASYKAEPPKPWAYALTRRKPARG